MKRFLITFSLISTVFFDTIAADGIRVYQPEDLPILKAAIASNQDLLLPGNTLEEQVAQTSRFFSSKNYTTQVFIKNDEIVGFITYQKVFTNRFIAWITGYQGVIQLLWVSENYRRQGIGASLLTHTLNDMKKIGFKKVMLMTKVANTASRPLYEKHGFKLASMIIPQIPDCMYQCTL